MWEGVPLFDVVDGVNSLVAVESRLLQYLVWKALMLKRKGESADGLYCGFFCID